ncbi:HNH endonuclease [Candidatus Epulonipiscium viviparus]|uniref:HNH endonuclease n=1 Tax=Candidatus Epulonipiscium viviparus TaxID=420336 RepID=UPI0027380D8D|nr:HNH endonuclease signature motif containing protein [Candidatus Epulopiscium viviparus]
MGYRDDWFKNNQPNANGQYKCVQCKNTFDKADIEIDHIIPKRKGGTDDLWNLQCMCRSCNRSKGARQTSGETAKSVFGAVCNGDALKLAGSMAGRKVKDMLGIKYKRK